MRIITFFHTLGEMLKEGRLRREHENFYLVTYARREKLYFENVYLHNTTTNKHLLSFHCEFNTGLSTA